VQGASSRLLLPSCACARLPSACQAGCGSCPGRSVLRVFTLLQKLVCVAFSLRVFGVRVQRALFHCGDVDIFLHTRENRVGGVGRSALLPGVVGRSALLLRRLLLEDLLVLGCLDRVLGCTNYTCVLLGLCGCVIGSSWIVV
jgi:hypothetical protein